MSWTYSILYSHRKKISSLLTRLALFRSGIYRIGLFALPLLGPASFYLRFIANPISSVAAAIVGSDDKTAIID